MPLFPFQNRQLITSLLNSWNRRSKGTTHTSDRPASRPLASMIRPIKGTEASPDLHRIRPHYHFPSSVPHAPFSTSSTLRHWSPLMPGHICRLTAPTPPMVRTEPSWVLADHCVWLPSFDESKCPCRHRAHLSSAPRALAASETCSLSSPLPLDLVTARLHRR
jgi:hypothetical protein